MEDVVILEWNYSPENYFEEDIHVDRDNYKILISAGKVEARINPEYYEKQNNLRNILHERLNDRFLGVQLFSHKIYELSKASMHRLHPDGRKDITLFVESCVMTMSVGNVDLIVKDKEGNIVADSKRERIDKKKKLAELVEKYSPKDTLVEFLLGSYSTSVTDPENELVHLYEIRDALSKAFSGEALTRKALGLSKSKWSRLGQLANNEPIKQGRHRGQSLGALRDATNDELQEARKIASTFIEAYLEYLDDKNR